MGNSSAPLGQLLRPLLERKRCSCAEVAVARLRLPLRCFARAASMAMDAGGGMGSSGGAAFANPPISNYKGVMLCDRPSADLGSSKPAPFNSAVVPPTQLGLNPPKKVNVYSTQNKPKGAPRAESAYRNPSRKIASPRCSNVVPRATVDVRAHWRRRRVRGVHQTPTPSCTNTSSTWRICRRISSCRRQKRHPWRTRA